MDKQTEQRIVDTTNQLLEENGMHDWKIRFSKAYRRLGSCSYKTKTIRISYIYAAALTWDEIHDTILHEVAHAIAGSAARHGIAWKRVAYRLGLENPASTTHTSAKIQRPWNGVCPNGHTTSRVQVPRRVNSCGKCGKGKFNKEFIFEWTKNGKKEPLSQGYYQEYNRIHATPATHRAARLYAYA